MRRARVNGIELEYEVIGAGEPVLMISPVLADGFRPLVRERALTDRYQLITYHRRGWVGSTHTPPPVTMADHAGGCGRTPRSSGDHRAHVAGHSTGAAVAVQLALDHPQRVQSLALLELSLLSVPAAAGFLEKAGPAFNEYAEGRPEAALATFMTRGERPRVGACRTLLDERIPGAVAQTIADADTFFGVELPALSAWTFGAEQAARVSQPVLSVVGPRRSRYGSKWPVACGPGSARSRSAPSRGPVTCCTSSEACRWPSALRRSLGGIRWRLAARRGWAAEERV